MSGVPTAFMDERAGSMGPSAPTSTTFRSWPAKSALLDSATEDRSNDLAKPEKRPRRVKDRQQKALPPEAAPPESRHCLAMRHCNLTVLLAPQSHRNLTAQADRPGSVATMIQVIPMRFSPGRHCRSMKPEDEGSWPLAKALAWVLLALMAVSTLYTGWIALANFDQIGV
jgi:hypothetical protein